MIDKSFWNKPDYLAFVKAKYPKDWERIFALWNQREDLIKRLFDLENELIQYAPGYVSPQSIEREKALDEFKSGMIRMKKDEVPEE